VDHDLTPIDDTIPRGVTGILHLGRGQTEFVLDSLKPGPHRVIAMVAVALVAGAVLGYISEMGAGMIAKKA